jgi:uncharacterized membrane protein
LISHFVVVRGSTRFGNFVVIAFLLAQAADGVFTYVGVSVYGLRMEGNPLLGYLMATMGQGAALAATKAAAGMFGIALHLGSVHKVVAALAALYIAVAILPWIRVLFFWS